MPDTLKLVHKMIFVSIVICSTLGSTPESVAGPLNHVRPVPSHAPSPCALLTWLCPDHVLRSTTSTHATCCRFDVPASCQLHRFLPALQQPFGGRGLDAWHTMQVCQKVLQEYAPTCLRAHMLAHSCIVGMSNRGKLRQALTG
eukprot:365712-Chlamydomonas_euryale.AAC.8